MMIVLDKLMNLKYYDKHPKCNEYSKQFFKNHASCNYNWQQEYEMTKATRLAFVKCFSKEKFLSQMLGLYGYPDFFRALWR